MRLDGDEPSSYSSDTGCNTIQPQPIRLTSALSLPSTSSEPDIDLTLPPSSLSESYVEAGPLSITPGKLPKPRSKQPKPTPSDDQFSTPAKPKRRRMNSSNDENSLSWFVAFLSKELTAASKEHEQQEKQDERIEMAEGVRYSTDPCRNSVLFYSRDSSILL